jgi:hypothetical protein
MDTNFAVSSGSAQIGRSKSTDCRSPGDETEAQACDKDHGAEAEQAQRFIARELDEADAESLVAPSPS